MEKEVLVKDISTKDGEDIFQVRIIKDEGVGLLTTQTDKNYLILDSLDYWYDLIQDKYPSKKKCSCKNDWFKIQFQYTFREHYDDIREVKAISTCYECGKTSTLTTIDIKYSPTKQLIETPIIYCEKPKIRYKCKSLNAFWNEDDLNNFLLFLTNELGYAIYVWYFKRPEKVRIFEKMESINIPKPFLHLYITKEKLDISSISDFSDEMGIYINRDLWRNHELLECSSLNMNGKPQYYIEYATQYINNKGETVNKSVTFEKDTDKLLEWLKENFSSKRGKNCFDGKSFKY